MSIDYIKKKIQNNRFLYYFAHGVYDFFWNFEYTLLYFIFYFIPLKNQVVATSFDGIKYGDNAKFIIEQLHFLAPEIKIIWFCDPNSTYQVPEYIQIVKCSSDKNTFKRAYYYYTSKVWINTHLYDRYLRKRKGQLVIETWHGGLGIKKIEGDVEKFINNRFQVAKIKHTSQLVDIFISNSDFLSNLYRRAFFYKKTIWKIGFPKDDLLLGKQDDCLIRRKTVRDYFGLNENVKIIVYAPTYRGDFEDKGELNKEPYDIDLNKVIECVERFWKERGVILVRWHPSMAKAMSDIHFCYNDKIIDATSYPEMQDIICASDAFISDYSSCLFEAALREIPCFIYANDYESYIGDRGAYFKLEQLPFPYATNMKEMLININNFNLVEFLNHWKDFCLEMGLVETGGASYNIAILIKDFLFLEGNMLKKVTGVLNSNERFENKNT